jgi:hypothetical protein
LNRSWVPLTLQKGRQSKIKRLSIYTCVSYMCRLVYSMPYAFYTRTTHPRSCWINLI